MCIRDRYKTVYFRLLTGSNVALHRGGGVRRQGVENIELYFYKALFCLLYTSIFGVYVIVKKYVDSKKVVIGNDAENYVSCSCCDDNFVSDTVA